MKRTHLTKKEFEKIKMLLDLGIPSKDAARLLDRGLSMVSLVRNSFDFAAYQETRRQAGKKYQLSKAQAVEQATPPEPQLSNNAEMVRVLQNINQSLVSIDQRLEQLQGSEIKQKSRFKW